MWNGLRYIIKKNMKTILVTGGAGFIGSHVTLLLLEKGFEVIVFDSFVNSSNKAMLSVLKILEKSNPHFKKIYLCIKEI